MKPFGLAVLAACAAMLFCPAVSAAPAGDVSKQLISTGGDRDDVAVTVYNDDLALIREQRHVGLPAGTTRLDLRDVAARLRPETALLRSLDGAPLRLLEQNFDFDLLTPQKLLEKAVGHEVTVVHPALPGVEERRERATVLAANQGVVLRFADRVETEAAGRIVFDAVPAELRDRPTLSVLLEGEGGKRGLELSYLSSGMSWKADYVANLSASNLDLDGWISVTNLSGATFEHAMLQFVAGNVHRAPATTRMISGVPAPALRQNIASEMAREEALLDYHLYSFDRRTTIADNQTKQLALLSATAVPFHREYILRASESGNRDRTGEGVQKLKPAVVLSFDNKGASMGKPLPAGVVRVYAKDSKGAAQFVGEDRIDHTARNETVRLEVGQAFDITAERTQIAFQRVAKDTVELSWRIDLRNAKDEAVTVSLREPISGDWEILQESDPHTKDSAHEARWSVLIPAGGEKTLSYQVRVKY
jgi:hypothetical protein